MNGTKLYLAYLICRLPFQYEDSYEVLGIFSNRKDAENIIERKKSLDCRGNICILYTDKEVEITL